MVEPEIELIEDENLWVFGPEQLLNVEYTVGSFQLPDRGENSVALILLTKFADKFLVCVPHKSWHKKAASRVLPVDFLEKPISVEVTACLSENRDEPLPGSLCKAWVGWLNKKYQKLLDFEDPSVPSHVFGLQEGGEECFPYADSLQAIAMEKFNVNFGPGQVPHSEGARLSAVEAQLGELKESLDALLKLQTTVPKPGGSGYQSAFEELETPILPPGLPVPAASSATPPPAKLGATPKKGAYPGLDPSTVSAALQAGVPAEHLSRMSSFLQKKPAKLGDLPKRPQLTTVAVDVLGDDPDDPDADSPDAEPELPADPVQRALVQLTHLVSDMNARKKGSRSLEETLDAVGQGALAPDGNITGGKKHVKAIEALKKALREDPKVIYGSIESRMAEDFGLQSPLPNIGTSGLTARAWVEHRSRIQPYARTVRWVWAVAGILDCLRDSRVEEARARAAIMIAQAEQESIDRGNYLLAQEMSLEPPAPLASFQQHQLPDATELQFTRLVDPRWIDAFTSKLKDMDDYIERRKKLGVRSQGSYYLKEENPAPKGKAKSAAKGKGKGKEAENTTES